MPGAHATGQVTRLPPQGLLQRKNVEEGFRCRICQPSLEAAGDNSRLKLVGNDGHDQAEGLLQTFSLKTLSGAFNLQIQPCIDSSGKLPT